MCVKHLQPEKNVGAILAVVAGEWHEEGELGIDDQLDNCYAVWRHENELAKNDTIYKVLATGIGTGAGV